MTMAAKLNQCAIRFLKSVLALSVVFLLLSMALCLTPLHYLASAEYILIFSLVALLLSSCILIPIKFVKVLLKLILSIGALLLAPFYLTIIIDIEAIIKNSTASDWAIRDSVVRLALHLLSWLITISTACKEGASDMRAPVEAHARNLQFFKKFSRFIGFVFTVGLVVLFFVDYTLIQTSLMHILWSLALYFIVELLLIRVSRDAIYIGLKFLNKRNFIARYVTFGVSAATSAVLFLVFKKKLDRLFVKLIEEIRNFFLYIAKLWKNFTNYFKRIFAVLAGKAKKDDPPFFDPSVLPEDVLEDFGMGDITISGDAGNTGDIGGVGGSGNIDGVGGAGGGIGSIGGSGGGIGSIGGGSGGGSGGQGGFGLAGTVGGALSESGKLGLGSNVEATQGNAAAMAFVRTEKDAVLYLKLKSFGDYNGKGWDEAVEYTGNWLYNTYSMNYLSGSAIARSGVESIGIEIVSLTGQYFLPDYMALGEYSYVAQASDVQMLGATKDMYSLEFYSYQKKSVILPVPDEFSALELQYRNFVYDQYLQLPEDTYNATLSFLQTNGITPYTSNQVQKVLNLFGKYTYNLEYDQTLDKQEDVVVSFLYEYKQGICQHFASAGVVMFRSLGIPARYVGGLYAGNVEGGEWTVVVANAAHAWVEIYQDGVGWIRLDPTSYAQYQGPTLENTFGKEEYNEIIKENEGVRPGPGGGSGDTSEGGPGGGSGDTSEGGPGGGSGDTSEDGPGGGSGDTSEDGPGGGSGDTSEGGSGGGSGDTSEDGPGGGSGDTSEGGSGGGSGDTSGDKSENDRSDGVENSSEEENTDSSSSEQEKDSSQEIQISEPKGCDKNALKTAGIVSAAVVGGTLIVVLILYLCKKKKPKILKKIKVNKKKLTVEEALAIAEAEDLAATQIIRNNYKSFIKLAGKNGIRQYPIDTTQSLRNKYNTEIGPNEAMEILTNLYRIARYNKDEKLTVEDANQSTYCLEVIKKAFVKKKKEQGK